MRLIPTSTPAVSLALASAALFGVSAPLAKLLLGEGLSPWLLAGMLYLASGLGLLLWRWGSSAFGVRREEAPLRRADLPWLVAVVVCGGAIGPVLLMYGLAQTSASSASLLLNLESLATMAIAWIAFRENVDRRLLIGAAAILLGCVILAWRGEAGGFGLGALAIVGACVAWGLDNNLTRKLSSADPVQISMIKGLVAGGVNLTLAIAAGSMLPDVRTIAAAGLIGFFGYGVSLVFFVIGLRHLGAARTGAYFSTAPFIGAVISVLMFDEPVTPQLLVAGALMAFGLYLHLTEAHEHEHEHPEIEHEHRHVHDLHHQHVHCAGVRLDEPHSHLHSHKPLRHSHAHFPDLHHRHPHGETRGD